MEKNEAQIIIRKTFAEKAKQQEQKLVTLADLSILIARIKEQLRDCSTRQHELQLLSELKLARIAHRNLQERIALGKSAS